jgi:cation diffusion facilitator CzcD-associated flavoprotein CzcO
MFTLGYDFRPWTGPKAIADGASILSYINETARSYDLGASIQFGRRVVAASWSTEQAHWQVTVDHTNTGQQEILTCSFLFVNAGYYRYDEGYTPELAGAETFTGQTIHPQHWPDDFDETGKKIVVIGSGATAVTLVPHLAQRAASVTLLQRSPTYIFTGPEEDRLANRIRSLLPAQLAYNVIRIKNIMLSTALYQLSRRRPGFMKRLLRRGLEQVLPEGFDIDTHFSPSYEPWDQRLCLDPDAKLLKAVADGSVVVVTDVIDHVTPTGIALESGKLLEADVIITATGLVLQALGGILVDVDGDVLEPGTRISYRGMMFSSVPNLAFTLGYTNASWTLKSDLVARYVCRLLNYMDEEGFASCAPNAPDPSAPTEPSFNLSSGYVLRSMDQIPRQGLAKPWRLHQSYPMDFFDLRFGGISDEMSFRRAPISTAIERS